jgi:putative pyruvate formate lyase activating enzyme
VQFDEGYSEEELWKVHDEYMKAYREYKRRAYSGKKDYRTNTVEKSLFDMKIAIAEKITENCHLCNHRCTVNRKRGDKGFCRLTDSSFYASEFIHMGEEPELVPSHTIFFSGCVLSCVYCQNWDISMYPGTGKKVEPVELARIIEKRRIKGAKNLNIVTPTPHLHNIFRILKEVNSNTPVVWNSNMYHSFEAGKLLEGVVDVFLADFKYGNNECALRYSKVEEYMETVTSNLIAGKDAEILMRHLVIPGHVECCTKNVIGWTSKNIPEVRFNLMFQYRPEYLAYMYPEINKYIGIEEREKAIKMAKDAGLTDILL